VCSSVFVISQPILDIDRGARNSSLTRAEPATRPLEGIFRELSEGVLAVLRGDRPAAVADSSLYDG
jgi:hypothetical protein